jgi:hypothetical protein
MQPQNPPTKPVMDVSAPPRPASLPPRPAAAFTPASGTVSAPAPESVVSSAAHAAVLPSPAAAPSASTPPEHTSLQVAPDPQEVPLSIPPVDDDASALSDGPSLPADEAPAPAPATKPGPTGPKAPVVLITMTIFGMLILSGLAIMVYLTSQS